MTTKFISTHIELNASKPVVTVEVTCEYVSIGDIIETFKQFLLASGFHPDLVSEYVSGQEE